MSPTNPPYLIGLTPSPHTRLPTFLIIFSLQVVLTTTELYRVPLHRSPYMVKEDVHFSSSVVTQQEKDLHGRPGQGYYMTLDIGQPPQQINVLVDTGSSNFAIAAAPHPDITNYFNTSKSQTFGNLGRNVVVPYTQGNWHGYLAQDVVYLPFLPNLTSRVNIACITNSNKFFINGSNWQGILGMAYRDIARPDATVDPFFDTLVETSKMNNTFSIQLCGTMDVDNSTDVGMGGTLILGGVDTSLYEGEVVYTPIRRQWYYEVIILDMAIAGHSLGLDCKEYNYDKTIVDSGTTNLRLPRTVYEAVTNKIKQAQASSVKSRPGPGGKKATPPPDGFWTGDKVLCWSEGQVPWQDFPTLTIHLAGSHNTTISLTISSHQYLRAVKETDHTIADDDCFKFAIAQSDTGTVLGAVLMEAFYVIFDRDQKRIGFAKSSCPDRDPISNNISVGGPQPYNGDTFTCGYVLPKPGRPVLVTIAYVMAGICGICLIPILLLIVQWQWNRCRQRHTNNTHDISNLLKDTDEEVR